MKIFGVEERFFYVVLLYILILPKVGVWKI